MRWLAIIAVVAGCASFEDPTIVLDLRVLGMESTPPEQILDVDPARPPTIEDVLDQLRPIRVRALIAEPDRNGQLDWSMTACVLDKESRCVEGGTSIPFAAGTLDDPETSSLGNPCEPGAFEAAGTACGLLVPDNRFVQMLLVALKDDPTGGLGGIEIGIELQVKPVQQTKSVAVFAAKHVLFAPRIPMDRRANNNPNIQQLLIEVGGDVGVDVAKLHCNDTGSINTVFGGDSVTLFPVAGDGDKEEYVLPTLDGGSERFTEYLTYQWIATAGSFTDEITGGPPDVFGNLRLDGTEWKAPEVSSSADVTIWVLQRDSRYGVRWREACIRVAPP